MVWLFSLGVVAGVCRSFPLFLGVVLFVLGRAVWLRAAHAWLAVPLGVACGAIGWMSIERADLDRRVVTRAAVHADGHAIRLHGWVDGFPQSGRYGTAFPFATTIDGHPVRLWVRAGVFDMAYGESLQLDAVLAASSRTPSAFLTSRGVAGEARARFDGVRRAPGVHGCPLMREALWPMHRAARTRLARALGADAALAVGLLLGERGTLDRPAYEAVRKLGIAHLLALSGMHLTMIAALALFATRWTPRRRDGCIALALSLYVGVVGNVDSLTRAYVMALLIIAARALVRPPNPVDALGKALFVMLLCAPTALLSVGLQLSFAATLAVLWCIARMPRWDGAQSTHRAWMRPLLQSARGAAGAFIVSVAVEVFIAPLQIHHFGRISVVGPFATVVFLVPVTVLQAMSLAASFDLPWVGEWIAAALAWASVATRDAIVVAGALAPDPVELPRVNWLLYYGAIGIALALIRARGRRHAAP